MNAKENQKRLDVSWDSIIIIDCLSEQEHKNWQIAEDLMQFLADKGITQQCYSCPDKKAFMQSCEHICKECLKDLKFCLHIVAHGNKDGIEIRTTKELISWKEIESSFIKINDAMEGQLLVNMTSCKGLNAIKIADKINSDPFFGIIGYVDDLPVDRAKDINKLFYSKIAEGKPVDIAISEINTELGIDKLCCISAEGYTTIKNQINNNKKQGI
jgi:hypothetical protein